MEVKLKGAALNGRVRAVESKSQAHRLLICAALSDGQTRIKCPSSSDDIDLTAGCLKALGAEIDCGEEGFTVSPIKPPADNTAAMNCGESASTLRFLFPLCCALGISASFEMSGRLPARPMAPLLNELVSHGCRVSRQGGSIIRCTGKLQSGIFSPPGDVSSQFISGLLFSLPLLEGDSEIRLTSRLESASYVEMTLDALRRFGIDIAREDTVFTVKGGGHYSSPGELEVEGDWSNAAFWLSAGAIGKKAVSCFGLNPSSSQGDRAIVDLLERFGANVERGENSVTVSGGELRGIEIDAVDIPDLVPVLAAVAAVAEGRTSIINSGRIRTKESDRLKSTFFVLNALGAQIEERQNGLIIHGQKSLRGGRVSSFGDHRITMMAAIAACACQGEVEITGAEAVNKSYPDFFKDYSSLSGLVEIV